MISCCAAFGRISGNDFISLDDWGYITKNHHIQSGLNLESIKWAFTTTYFTYWHPLTWISHMLDWSLFGANASGHHLVSVFLHIGAAILLFLFLNKTTHHLWLSAFAAAFFALHPLRVESVAWAAERKDVLCMFFGMACLYVYVSYARRGQLSRYLLCLLLFAMALMSKPMMVTLPFVLLLLDYWPLERWQRILDESSKNRFQSAGKLVLEKIPFLLFTIASAVLTFLAQQQVEAVAPFPIDVRIANTIVSYSSYLAKIFYPMNLAVFYPYHFSLPLWKIIISGTFIIFMTCAAVYHMKKVPFLFVGWFWYLGTFIPLIGLVQAGGHAIADRHTYLPSIGIAIMLAWGIPFIINSKNIRKMILFPAAIAILTILATFTWLQCGYWKDSINLYSRTLQVTKNNDRIHANLGLIFLEKGNISQAIYHYDKAIHIAPYYGYYGSRAQAYVKAGRFQKAIDDYDMIIRLKPDSADAYKSRGLAYFNLGKNELGCEDVRKACVLKKCKALDLARDKGLCP